MAVLYQVLWPPELSGLMSALAVIFDGRGGHEEAGRQDDAAHVVL